MDRLPVHEADELQQRGRAGRRADPVLGRAGRRPRHPPRPLGVPAQRHRRPRPLLRVRPRRPRRVPRHPPGRAGRARPGRRRRRRPRPRRPLLVLPVGRADRGGRARASTSTGQLTVTGGLSFAGGPWNNYVTHSIATMVGVLRDDPGSVGPRHRQRRLHHQARLRRLQHRAAGRRRSATRTCRPRSTRSPAATLCEAPDGAGRHRGVDGDARPRRRSRERARRRPARRRPAGLGHHAGRRPAAGDGHRGARPAARPTSAPTAPSTSADRPCGDFPVSPNPGQRRQDL